MHSNALAMSSPNSREVARIEVGLGSTK